MCKRFCQWLDEPTNIVELAFCLCLHGVYILYMHADVHVHKWICNLFYTKNQPPSIAISLAV